MINAILENQFVIGLLVGMIITLIVWVSGWSKRRELQKKLAEQEKKLATSTEYITNVAGGLATEVSQLKEQIANQQITIKTLQQEPKKQDLRTLVLCARAYDEMVAKAPGFAQAWQSCIKQILQDEEKESQGMLIFRHPIAYLSKILTGSPHKLSPEINDSIRQTVKEYSDVSDKKEENR